MSWRAYVKVRRRHHANQTYEYLDIVESHRIDGRVQQRKLGCLGRLDQLDRKQIDRLIEYLRRFASPEALAGVTLGAVEIVAVRQYGVALAVQQLWSELGLDGLLASLPQKSKPPIRDELFQEAVFRMVVTGSAIPTASSAWWTGPMSTGPIIEVGSARFSGAGRWISTTTTTCWR